MPPHGQRQEHAEQAVRSRVVACRQRLRRLRAAQQRPQDARASADATGAGEHAAVDSQRLDDEEFSGVMQKANAEPDWPVRLR